jgi:hypothetical protein
MWSWRVPGQAAALAVLSFAGRASGAELLLAQPSACAIGDEVSFRAERALGRRLASAADVRCTIRIERERDAFAARLELASADASAATHERRFRAASCEQLTDTLALAVVLAVGTHENADGELDAAAAAETRGAVAALDTDASPAASDAVDITLRASNASENSAALAVAHPLDTTSAAEPAGETGSGEGGLRWGVRAAWAIDAGALPSTAFGPSLGASLGGEALELRVLGTYLLPSEATVVTTSTAPAGIELSLAAGSVLGCAPRLLHAADFTWGACAGAELGAMWGSGTRVSVSRERGRLWSAARADLSGRWALGGGPLGLDLMVGALVPLARDDFMISAAGEALVVHRPAAVVGRLGLGLSLELD